MKKFTFLMIALLAAVVTFAAGPKKQFDALPFTPAKANVQMGKQFNAKQAPAAVAKKFQKAAKAKARSPKKVVAAADLVGDYQWDYLQTSDDLDTATPETVTTTAGSARVSIALGEASEPASTETVATFDFNAMDVATSNNATHDGDITETLELTDKDATLAISPQDEGASNPNRFWSFSAGPQLRVYSGTLTFSVPEGLEMTQIVFNAAKWNDGNAFDAGEFANNTWTGNAQTLVLSIGGNTQINSIEVTYNDPNAEVVEGDPIVISGLFTNDLEGTFVNGEEVDYIMIPAGQIAGTSSYGNYAAYGLFYFEGDEENEAGYYNDDIYGVLEEDGSITFITGFVRVLSGGQYDGYYLTPYWVEGSTLTPAEPLTVVEVPEGLVTEEYSLTARNYNDNADVSGSVQIGFDGNDVYVQGLSTMLPEAWVKGTLDGTTITFATGQYLGNYADTYDMFLNVLMGEDVVFDYDAEAGTLTAQNEFFLIDNSEYYFDSYRGCVLKKVIEKAAMPANPEITALTNGTYGWYFTFNVPTVDVNGDGLATSKLAYMIYTDIEGEIAPLTFTPETHTRLTEAITEIPYGFTETYDFYDTQIYLNELYSADWNNLGIQSIYRGGDEENVTEIQWFHIKDYTTPVEVVTHDYTFNFLEMDVATSDGNGSTAGDITETLELTEGDVTLAISPKDENAETENRFWGTKTGPQLRVYSGTLTFSVPEGCSITQIEFNHNGKWGANTAAPGEIENDEDSNVATWTGDAQQVVVTIAANSQINSILVTVKGESKPGPGPEPGDLTTVVYDFEDGTMQGWTTIDADGDGFDWTLGASPSINTVNDSDYSVYSESYNSDAGGALTPDNYLVSPQIKLDGSISFYACAQDGEWAAEHFAVAVSTKGNTDVADFTNVQEWTMTASRVDNPSFAPGKFRSPRKTPGAWYKYTVDLSSYEGAEGYVAIRHFDCTDNFYIVVDDIEIKTSHVTMPDFTISPAEGVVESLSDFEITFNNYDIAVAEDAAATLKNTTTLDTYVTSFDVEENKILISYEEVTEPGDYTLTVTGVKTAEGEDVELSFNYTIEAAPEVVVLPEGLEADTWYFSATASESSVRNQEVAIAIDGSDIYIQGLNIDFLPEAWVKGTIEGNTATFPSGQYFGAFEYNTTSYDMFFLGYDSTTKEVTDVVFTIDDEAGKMTTDQMIVINGKKDVVSYYEYYYDVVITHEIPETPDLVALPEGVEAEDWTIDGTYTDSWGGNNIVQATEVAFDGSDIYVKGLASYFEDSWIKGTINAETGIATFPSGQFVGEDEYGWEFMVGSEDFETLCDIEFEYDAEAQTLTQLTPYIIENGDDPDVLSAYGYWSDVIIYAGEPIYEEPIEAPEGLVTETYLFTAVAVENGAEDLARKAEGEEAATTATFDFNAMDVATSDGNGSAAGDITETLSLTEGNVTLTISPKDGSSTENRFWSTANGPQLRVYSGTLTFSVPEGSSMTQIVFNNGKWNAGNSADSGEFNDATWTGDAQTVVVTIAGNTQLNSIEVTVEGEGGEEPEPIVVEPNYSFQTQVGFDGNDVYFKGVSDDTADMWLKGTLSEDGKTVTIPANQYMGEATSLWFTFPYYFTAVGEDGETMEDIVLNYDAENNKFTTDQVLVLHDGKRSIGEPYQTFTEVEISKMEEFAATPADPSIDELALTGSLPKAYFIIPAEDVDGNVILTSKLFYTVWIEEDGVEKPFTAVAGEGFYSKATEDMTEIPYDYNDNYDIYKGGSVFYFNPVEAVANWTKIGIQSIYYGGGECNKSSIVWDNGSVTTGIANVTVETSKNSAVFDLQGRRVSNPGKGLYIVDGKKVVMK